MIAHLISAIVQATGATTALSDELRRLASSPAPAPTRNGGRHRTVAHQQRQAAKRRATRRAKRLGHQ
ncbi:MAG: hypothetical protein ACOC0M_00090 [Halomonas sp.]